MILRQKLSSLRGKKFTGRIDILQANGKEWRLYLCLGRIIWADGGNQSYRAWERLINNYCPHLDYKLIDLEKAKEFECWNYYIIVSLLKRFLITKEQAIKIIIERIKEVLFDIYQAEIKENLLYDFVNILDNFPEESGIKTSVTLFKIETILDTVESNWLIWQKEGLTPWSASHAPIIKNPAILRQNFNDRTYKKIVSLFDGKSTLREIASQLKLDVLKIAKWLKPYFQKGLIELIEVRDQKIEVTLIGVSNSHYKITKTTQTKVIFCVDDSLQICQIMEHIVTKVGYKFIFTQNPLKAIPEILKNKPDLIFLDLVMPIANGYEICAQIRRISQLKNTPILILTSNDSMIDRMRSKMVGATGFFSKPINEEKILQKIDSLLHQKLAKTDNSD